MKKVFLVLLAGMLLFGYGCANIIAQMKKMEGDDSSIAVKKLVPAEVDVSKYRKIAVFDFEGNGGKDIAEWMEIALQNVRTDERPFFEIITRSKMKELLTEKIWGLKGLIDPDNVAKIGKISGVQAIVTGRVTAYGVKDSPYTKQVTRTRKNRQYKENVPCKARSAYVDLTVNFLDVQTGQIMASSSIDGQMVAEECQGGGDLGQLLDKMITDAIFRSVPKQTDNIKVVPMDIPARMQKGAANLAIGSFVKKITPSYQLVPIVILEGDYAGFTSAFKEKPQSEKLVQVYYEVGYKYGIRGQWEDAIKQWEKILEIDPQRPAAIYNIGVAFEMTGDLFLAEKQFKTAADIRPDDLFFNALSRVRKSIDERKKPGKSPGGGREQPPVGQERSTPRPEQKIPKEQKPMPPNEEKDKGKTIQPTTNNPISKIKIKSVSAQVRDLAQNKAKIISTLTEGREIEKLQEKGVWLKIRFSNNGVEAEGWISKYDCEGYTQKAPKLKNKQTSPPKEGSKKVSPL